MKSVICNCLKNWSVRRWISGRLNEKFHFYWLLYVALMMHLLLHIQITYSRCLYKMNCEQLIFSLSTALTLHSYFSFLSLFIHFSVHFLILLKNNILKCEARKFSTVELFVNLSISFKVEFIRMHFYVLRLKKICWFFPRFQSSWFLTFYVNCFVGSELLLFVEQKKGYTKSIKQSRLILIISQ